ncbi:AAA family ATPase [Candidatus Poriferisodalis sp.]|uniref:AAA family ATPase n=1 Tax=Candidatus Poriferisodalis sp. TaxID=3101277 RepID=UPI003AF70B4E
MDRSPFPHHGPLRPEQVTGRESLAVDLAQRIADRRLTALVGPRRFGKTSLLKRVAADLAAVGPQPVWIDLYQLTSMADFAAAVDRGLASVVGPVRRALDSIAATVALRIGVLGVELTRSPKYRPDPVLSLRNLLGVLTSAAQRHDLFVVFDEFSGVANIQGGAGVLRTELQHHFQSLGIVFAGSEPSTMRALFSEQTQPFFAQADLVEIGPLSDAAVGHIVEDGFETTQRHTGGITSRIVAFAAGHPQRAMQLADALWRRVEPGETADMPAWEAALAEVRTNVNAASERIFSLLPTGQQKTLRAIAAGGSIYGAAASALELPPGSAQDAAEKLIGNGIVRRAQERLEVIDPLLADWLCRRFPI